MQGGPKHRLGQRAVDGVAAGNVRLGNSHRSQGDFHGGLDRMLAVENGIQQRLFPVSISEIAPSALVPEPVGLALCPAEFSEFFADFSGYRHRFCRSAQWKAQSEFGVPAQENLGPGAHLHGRY